MRNTSTSSLAKIASTPLSPMIAIVRTVVVVFLIATDSTCLAASCFFPDSSPQESPDYQPCNSTAGHKMCCATNRKTTSVNSCIQHGLCADADKNIMWRETCSDPTWQDEGCLKLCIDGLGRLFSRVYL
jgi:hypothetical protein